MENHFDALARDLAPGLPRSEALRRRRGPGPGLGARATFQGPWDNSDQRRERSMKRRMSGVFSMTVAAPAILAGLIALGLVARPAMAAGGATPITASTVITAPGQYVVTASFTGGIEITVSDVHLDLGGQTITDVTSFDAIKVYPGANDVVITNGTVATSNPGGN